MTEDKIRVITQTTEEQKKEIADLWKQCQPLLQQGYSLNKAVREIKGLNHHSFTRRAWYRDLLHYAKSQGYRGY